MKKKLRLYLDTSVFGGYFDKEFEEHSIPVVKGIIKRQAHLLISSVVTDELAKAPTEVRDLILKIPDDVLEFIALSSEVKELTNQYISKKVVSKKSLSDATHVALKPGARPTPSFHGTLSISSG
jgi:predicted nucleic acid-binding protein